MTQANDGAVNCTGSNCSYTPDDPSFHGADSFTYTISDGNGETAVGLVSVLVTTTNGQPVADDDELTVVEDASGAVDVLDDDSDPDDDPLTLTTPSSGRRPRHGLMHLRRLCTYTPDPDFFGTDAFSYEIDDGQGGADTGDVAVTVTAVNDDPNAVNDSLIVQEDEQGTLNVRTNDTDVDLDTLLVTTPSPTAAHGTVSCLGGGRMHLHADGRLQRPRLLPVHDLGRPRRHGHRHRQRDGQSREHRAGRRRRLPDDRRRHGRQRQRARRETRTQKATRSV